VPWKPDRAVIGDRFRSPVGEEGVLEEDRRSDVYNGQSGPVQHLLAEPMLPLLGRIRHLRQAHLSRQWSQSDRTWTNSTGGSDLALARRDGSDPASSGRRLALAARVGFPCRAWALQRRDKLLAVAPLVEILSRIVRIPVGCCFDTSPSHAPRAAHATIRSDAPADEDDGDSEHEDAGPRASGRGRVGAESPNSRKARSWRGMRRILAVSLMLVALPGLVAPALAQTVGIVLMHGKTGSPNTVIDRLASDLQSAGYLVDTPEMCWSRQRIYDRPFLDCLTEIDSAIGRLKGRGAGRIVVAGMSQGGDAALAYGARNANLAGIIALAPAAAPERQVGLPDIAQSVAQARTHPLEIVAECSGLEIPPAQPRAGW
jgi:pimeloyl-ACP methyl ester carboxylesterase